MSIIPEGWLLKRANHVEGMVADVMNKLRTQYHVSVPELEIVWGEADPYSSQGIACVRDSILYLNRNDLVVIPCDTNYRNTLVTLEIEMLGEKIPITFPFGKIIDWLDPMPRALQSLESTPPTDEHIRLQVARTIMLYSLALMGTDNWLNTDNSNARCIRNGIVDAYGHLLSGTMPTSVSERIWEVGDDAVQRWREAEGGFPLLYPHLKDYFQFDEVIQRFEKAGPPAIDENLPHYIERTLGTL